MPLWRTEHTAAYTQTGQRPFVEGEESSPALSIDGTLYPEQTTSAALLTAAPQSRFLFSFLLRLQAIKPHCPTLSSLAQSGRIVKHWSGSSVRFASWALFSLI